MLRVNEEVEVSTRLPAYHLHLSCSVLAQQSLPIKNISFFSSLFVIWTKKTQTTDLHNCLTYFTVWCISSVAHYKIKIMMKYINESFLAEIYQKINCATCCCVFNSVGKLLIYWLLSLLQTLLLYLCKNIQLNYIWKCASINIIPLVFHV